MPDQPSTTPPACALRALPRVAGVIGALVLLTSYRQGPPLWIGIMLFVGSVPPQPLVWWRYVRTGRNKIANQVAPYSEPGDRTVDLQRVGEDEAAVVRAVSRLSGLPQRQARKIVREAPCPLLDGVSTQSAERTRNLLAEAGATARIGRSRKRP